MVRRCATTWGLLCLVLVVAGCAPVRPGTAPAQPSAGAAVGEITATNKFTVSQNAIITMETPVGSNTNINLPAVKAAVLDLAARQGVAAEAITVVSAEAVVWPDGALGCPQPGRVYPQVLQDGMRIILEADGQRFEYHSGETRPPFLCTTPAKRPPLPPANDNSQ